MKYLESNKLIETRNNRANGMNQIRSSTWLKRKIQLKKNQKNREGKKRINKDYRKWESWRKSTKRQDVVFMKWESQRRKRVRWIWYLYKSAMKVYLWLKHLLQIHQLDQLRPKQPYQCLRLRHFQRLKKRQRMKMLDMLQLRRHQNRLWPS